MNRVWTSQGRNVLRRSVVPSILAIVVLGAAVLVLNVLVRGTGPADTDEDTLSLAAALSSDTSGYARADAVRPFHFPADHGPHPDFRTEWWYYTGNLLAESGRRFAYQFTIFRTALAPPADADSVLSPSSASHVPTQRATDETWSTRQLYMAHFALTDVRSGTHVAFERFSRDAADLAGAEADPYRVWLEDWEVMGLPGADSVRIRAAEEDLTLDLVLSRAKPIVLRGDRGLDQKGPDPGNASYYYSMTRMATRGTIYENGTEHSVRGWSWLDREWSTSALSSDQVGWDWFSLQLDDDVEVMYYRLRRSDGSTGAYSNGVITEPDGQDQFLSTADVQLDVLGTWESPTSGIGYPSSWRLEIPKADAVLALEPLVADQELNVSIRYWEGAVRVRGTYRGQSVEGYGFVELTGYGDEETL